MRAVPCLQACQESRVTTTVHCPFCKAEDTSVIDSRLHEDGSQVKRRRKCDKCGQRFSTFEKASLAMPQVLKRSGDPEPYSESKLRRGMESALYKRPVTPEQVDHLIERVELRLRSQPEREIPSRRIGEWVMEELRDLDQVAYVRFASIYHAFQDVHGFREAVERVLAFPTAEQRKNQLPLIEPDPASAPSTVRTAPDTLPTKK